MVNEFVKECKKKIIFSLFFIILFVALFFRGYFSDSVTQIIVTKAKLTSQEYITTILTKAGIEFTENINSIISGVIALTCYLMPHDRKISEE